MADFNGLRAIGLGFAVVTTAVMIIAALVVSDATRTIADPVPVAVAGVIV